MSRLKKFKKRKTLILVSKIFAIFYLITFAFGYLSSGTGAYFIDSNGEKQVIQAGTWWDGSDLVFTGKPTQNNKACPPLDISVQIKNNGSSMIDSTKYEVYYSEQGNPRNTGEKIEEGAINPIAKGGTDTLTYKAEKIGSYMFKAFQRPDYSGKGKKELWSEKVMVKCLEKQEEDSTKESKKEIISNEETSDQGKEDNTSGSQTETSKGEETETETGDSSESVINNDESKQENKDNATSEKADDGSSVENEKQEENTKVEDNNKENVTTENPDKKSETVTSEGAETNEQTK